MGSLRVKIGKRGGYGTNDSGSFQAAGTSSVALDRGAGGVGGFPDFQSRCQSGPRCAGGMGGRNRATSRGSGFGQNEDHIVGGTAQAQLTEAPRCPLISRYFTRKLGPSMMQRS